MTASRAVRRIPVTIGEHRLAAELAADPLRRAIGLMLRTHLPQDAGMLFVFPEDDLLGFWMRWTLLPLSIAFLDAEGRILNVEDMEPLDEQVLHCSVRPARYAIEAHRGWFSARGIGPGDFCAFELPQDLLVE
jgi:hypothetical protein